MRNSRCPGASILMADPGRTGPHLGPLYGWYPRSFTKRIFNRQAAAKAGTDQAFDAFATYIMSYHLAGLLARQVATTRS
jgi:hypothetical protein